MSTYTSSTAPRTRCRRTWSDCARGAPRGEAGGLALRELALRELALGVEALERFVWRESLRRVHECVFGVLALESEPVDPQM